MDDDIQVLGAFSLEFLFNQDTTNICTSIEQVALNQQTHFKLLNMCGQMSQSVGESKAKDSLIINATRMARVYGGQNVFYVDQMAKAFLVICKVLAHENILDMVRFVDQSIFEPELTFTKLNDYGKSLTSSSDDNSNFSESPKKRAKKQSEKSSNSKSNQSESRNASPMVKKAKVQKSGSGRKRSRVSKQQKIDDYSEPSNINSLMSNMH